MSLSSKLQMTEGQAVRLVNAPKGFPIDAPTTRARNADAVVAFVKDRAELERYRDVVVEQARAERLAWLAYPKAGQLGTDLNRDTVWELLRGSGARPVRQVALDETWSALRFRPDAAGAEPSRAR
jgi:hypothetical protein